MSSIKGYAVLCKNAVMVSLIILIDVTTTFDLVSQGNYDCSTAIVRNLVAFWKNFNE